jgi:hypothetical protein
MKVNVEYYYNQKFLPTKRHKKIRERQVKDILSVTIVELNADVFPVAFRVHDMQAVTEGMAYKNRHIAKLESQNDDLKLVNGTLTDKTLYWADRACLNKAIRTMANVRSVPIGQVWKELYDELLYGYHINLKARGGKPYIAHIRKEEWSNVVKVFTAMCEKRYLNTADILRKAKIKTEDKSKGRKED